MNSADHTSLFDLAASFVLHTNRHIFLTGKAGTGKTTFLKHIKEQTSKKTVIVAPTGVAAINAGGVTMHSFFQLPIGCFIPEKIRGFSSAPSNGTDLQTLISNIRFNKEKRKLIEELELLVIDEVSMLRADMLDAIDGILRHFRKNISTPFGGVQLLYIGDLYQLPPVVKEDEWNYLGKYYKSIFFFDAQVMKDAHPVCVELEKIYRQSDQQFIELLNNIRNNIATEDDLKLLNKYYDPYFYPDAEEGYIILTSHNYKADKINQGALAKLNNETYLFEGTLSGDFNENALPVDKNLALKAGAQIMFIRNDKGEDRRYYNGKIGVISRIKNEEIYVRFPNEREELQLEKEVWRNIKYKYNDSSDQIEEEELGSYKQYPVRLAWAVTIHKSQGLTFEKAIIDAGQSFAPGQVYVALSRLTSLKGLVLSSQISSNAISTEQRIVAYTRDYANNNNLQYELQQAQKDFLTDRLLKCFEWNKTTEAFREHLDAYKERKLPHMSEAMAWAQEMVQQCIALKEVSERFAGQLRRLTSSADQDHYESLKERTMAAAQYFSKEINEKLIKPWQLHFEQTKIKTKVKKYTRELQDLFALLNRKLQQTEQAVMMVSGMAEGKNITHLLQHYQNTSKQLSAPSETELKITVKGDSKMISLQLLQQGRDIDDIAKERGLVRSTIEGHLAHFVISGEVKLSQLVDAEKEKTIREAIKKNQDKELSAIRSSLNNTCSYSEIRAVMNQLEREKMM